MAIHCPYCGSTAQVKSMGSATISKDGETLKDLLQCGCGCVFSHTYKRNQHGYWQIDWTQIIHHKKNKKI